MKSFHSLEHVPPGAQKRAAAYIQTATLMVTWPLIFYYIGKSSGFPI